MKFYKIFPIILIAISLIGCVNNKKNEDNNSSEPQSSIYLKEEESLNPDFYAFSIDDRAVATKEDSHASHAIAKEYFIDEDGKKFLSGTNPSLSFHIENEILVVKTRLKSKNLPPDFKYLAQASEAKEKTTSRSEEEIAFLFTNRRLDLPFILIETFRGKRKISEAVNNLIDREAEIRSVEFKLQRKDTNDNPFSKLVTLNLSSTLKEADLPKKLIEYIRN